MAARTDFGQRFAEYDSEIKQALTNRHVIWMHAVSVGEMNVCLQVIRALQPRMPNLKIMVSTTTTTGLAATIMAPAGTTTARMPVSADCLSRF